MPFSDGYLRKLKKGDKAKHHDEGGLNLFLSPAGGKLWHHKNKRGRHGYAPFPFKRSPFMFTAAIVNARRGFFFSPSFPLPPSPLQLFRHNTVY